MEKLSKRPFLLAGTIFNVVCLLLLAITSSVNLFNIFVDMDTSVNADALLIFSIFVNIMLIALSLVGIVMSAICMMRVNISVKAFHGKRFLILSTFILNIVAIVFALLAMKIAFDILTLFVCLALICASVFIFLDYYKNKVRFYKEQAEEVKEIK